MKYIFIILLSTSLSMAQAQTLQRKAITAAGNNYADNKGQTLTFCNGKPHWGPCP